MEWQKRKCVHEILPQGGVNGLRILFGFETGLINANELLSFPRFFAKAVVGDAVEPGGKFRLAPETPDVFESLEEGFLGEIVSERGIGSGELTKQTSDRRLMTPDQFGEGMVVIIEKDSGDEVCIGQRHSATLGQRRRIVGTGFPGVVFQSVHFSGFEFPDEEITAAD